MLTIITECFSPPSTLAAATGAAGIGKSLARIAAVILALHLLGWGTLLAVVVPQHLSVGTTAFGLGIGTTAYLLGVRHAFDADHIAAIDNTTRRLIHAGTASLSVGFWFSLGHSSVVFGLTLLLASGISALAGPLLGETSSLHSIASLVGTLVSSSFLYLVAALNTVVLVDIWRVLRRLRAGTCDAAMLESPPRGQGFMSRLLEPMAKLVARPRQMYLVGFLFGLGFDTATEVALLVLAGSGAASGLPWYAMLCLPVLFAAGMSLFDTIDGSFMAMAYGWALNAPTRKVTYNLVVTSLSIAVALAIGTVEIAGLLTQRLRLNGAFWIWAENADLSRAGMIVVAGFLVITFGGVAIWRLGATRRA